MNKEKWKCIVGFEDYQVSNLGRVKSVKFGKERILKFSKNAYGYLRVQLWKDGKVKIFFIHRLVYQTFVGEIPEGFEINHIDEDKTNNRLDNLILMTPKENSNWGTRNERVAEKISKEVIQCDLDGNEIARYKSTREVQRQLGFASSHISETCNEIIKTAYGYIWKYA